MVCLNYLCSRHKVEIQHYSNMLCIYKIEILTVRFAGLKWYFIIWVEQIEVKPSCISLFRLW